MNGFLFEKQISDLMDVISLEAGSGPVTNTQTIQTIEKKTEQFLGYPTQFVGAGSWSTVFKTKHNNNTIIFTKQPEGFILSKQAKQIFPIRVPDVYSQQNYSFFSVFETEYVETQTFDYNQLNKTQKTEIIDFFLKKPDASLLDFHSERCSVLQCGCHVFCECIALEATKVLQTADFTVFDGTETIIHGDFHPENILVNTTGELFIIDWPRFGIAPASYEYVDMERQVRRPPQTLMRENSMNILTDVYAHTPVNKYDSLMEQISLACLIEAHRHVSKSFHANKKPHVLSQIWLKAALTGYKQKTPPSILYGKTKAIN